MTMEPKNSPYVHCSGCSRSGDSTHQEGTIEHPLVERPKPAAEGPARVARLHGGYCVDLLGEKMVLDFYMDSACETLETAEYQASLVNKAISPFVAKAAIVERLSQVLQDAIYSIQGEISHSPYPIYTPHIEVSTVNEWRKVLTEYAALGGKR